MSTRSNIVFVHPNGEVTVAYCHYDGYPSGVGRALVSDHNTDSDAEYLIRHGAIRTICSGVQFFTDGDTPNIKYSSVNSYLSSLENDVFIEYSYKWENGHWEVCKPRRGHGWMSIEDGVEKYENNYED